MPEHKSEIIPVPINKMIFDPSYNRTPNDGRIAKIAAEFNPDFFGTPTVSLRENGDFAVVDGQHRISAVRLIGWQDREVDARCYYDLTIMEEARLHGGLNNLAKPTPVDIFRSRAAAGEPIAVAIRDIIAEFGLKVSHSGTHTLSAVSAVEKIYTGRLVRAKGSYPEVLRTTMRILTDAFGAEVTSVQAALLEAVALMQFRYADKIDETFLITKLAGYPGGVPGLLGQAHVWRNVRGGGLPDAVAEVIVGFYNKTKRGSKALPDWRVSR